jgi:GNAT superfamily N-acetyltransferase
VPHTPLLRVGVLRVFLAVGLGCRNLDLQGCGFFSFVAFVEAALRRHLGFALLSSVFSLFSSLYLKLKTDNSVGSPFHLRLSFFHARHPARPIFGLRRHLVHSRTHPSRGRNLHPSSRHHSRRRSLFWFSPAHNVFVAHDDGHIVGTYFLRPNQNGGGSYVANCGYMTAPAASGRGVARAMCAHSLDYARNCDFRAMQFNFVVSTNERAVRRWQSFGFEIVGGLPGAFLRPAGGYTDAYVMYPGYFVFPNVEAALRRHLAFAFLFAYLKLKTDN